MTDQEFEKTVLAIKAAYPNFNVLPDKYAMKIWYQALMDIDYQVVENAVWEHISTSAFPPSIAGIRKLCMERCGQSLLSFDEAWGVVQKAIATYGWYHPQEAFETMDKLTLAVVKNLGWTRLCQSENLVAERANFREAYEARAKSLQARNQLPEFVAAKKALLKEQHVSDIEEKPRQVLGNAERVPDPRAGLTSEQSEERVKKFREARRRILSGEGKAE